MLEKRHAKEREGKNVNDNIMSGVNLKKIRETNDQTKEVGKMKKNPNKYET